MANKSLRGKLTLQFTSIITGLFVVMSLFLFWNAHRVAIRNMNRTLEAAAGRIRLDIREAGLAEVMKEAPQEMHTDDLALIIVDPKGQRIFRSQRYVPSWPRTKDGWRIISVRYAGHKVVIGYPWWKEEAGLERLGIFLVVQTLFVPLFAYLAAGFLIGRTLMPISQLSEQASEAHANKLRVVLKSPSADKELVGLVDTLNGLLGRIAETAASRGRFYAAASHELRTPLQALSGHLELALSNPRSADEYRAALEEANAQAGRLISLVRGLLFLNQLDVQGAQIEQYEVDLSEICHSEMERAAGPAQSRDVKVIHELVDASILAAPNHAEVLVRNLLENAVKYGPEHGEVKLTIQTDDCAPRLVVQNTCSKNALPPNDAVFEPFYRPDSSRSGKTGGNGLGLAICKAICDANGWNISIEAPGDTVLATVSFTKRECNGT